MKQPDWLELMGNLNPEYIEEALRFDSFHEKENHPMKKNRKATLFMMKLAAVIALIAALGITAYATGIVDSVIAKIANAWAVYDEERAARYESAAEKANREPETETLDQLDGIAMTLEESYYDGESLMIVYSLDALRQPLSFDFGPDSENFDKLTKDNNIELVNLPGIFGFTEEEYQTICDKLQRDGKVGFVCRQVGLGDHVLLTDGLDLGPMMGFETDGKYFMECQDGLPEEAKGRDRLDVEFTVRRSAYFFYAEGEDLYFYHDGAEQEKVIFTVENCSKP